jgi:hypothetical protein
MLSDDYGLQTGVIEAGSKGECDEDWDSLPIRGSFGSGEPESSNTRKAEGMKAAEGKQSRHEGECLLRSAGLLPARLTSWPPPIFSERRETRFRILFPIRKTRHEDLAARR